MLHNFKIKVNFEIMVETETYFPKRNLIRTIFLLEISGVELLLSLFN
jgi:hypothetical protein